MATIKKKPRGYWSKMRVIATIGEVFPKGLDEPQDRVAAAKLVRVGKRYFGSWPAALIAAGKLLPGEEIPYYRQWECFPAPSLPSKIAMPAD